MESLLAFNWYGFLIGGAMLLCIGLAYLLLHHLGYYPDIVLNVALICIPCAIVGARLYYVIFDILGGDHAASYWTFKRILGIEDGGLPQLSGLAIYGGLIAATLGAIIVRALNKKEKDPLKQMTYLQILDVFYCLVILGQIIGRWGNFANQEVYGQEITNPAFQHFPFAVHIVKPLEHIDGYYQALFFYESFFNMIGMGIMLWMLLGKRKSFDGAIFGFYCIWYGTVRVILEGMRPREYLLYWGSIRASQLLSGLLIALGVAIYVYHIIAAKNKGKQLYLFVNKKKLDTSYFGYDKTIMYKKEQAKTQRSAQIPPIAPLPPPATP